MEHCRGKVNRRVPHIICIHLNASYTLLYSELGSLGKLKYIYISHNELTGTIPSAFFANWMSIKQIDMSKNSFSGTLPNMNAISSIESINLSENSLEGIFLLFQLIFFDYLTKQ